MEECDSCPDLAESEKCPECGLTGPEIYVARWEAEHGVTHPANWHK